MGSSGTFESMAEPPPLDRPDLFLVARFLERLWREPGPILKTHLQMAANVNYDVFLRYLAWLRARGLVMLDNNSDGHERVSITEKGKRAYRRLVEWLDDFSPGRP